MDLPEFSKDEIPQEIVDKVGEDFEIVPLTNEDYKPTVDKGKDDYLTRKVLRQLDEMGALQEIHKKKLSKKETWKEMKKVQRYYKSSLYAIKALDRGTTVPYNSEREES